MKNILISIAAITFLFTTTAIAGEDKTGIIKVKHYIKIGKIKCNCFKYDYIKPGEGWVKIEKDGAGMTIQFKNMTKDNIEMFNTLSKKLNCPINIRLDKDGSLYFINVNKQQPKKKRKNYQTNRVYKV